MRRPTVADAEAIFARYAADVDVTRYLSWPRHTSVESVQAFLAWSDAEWQRWPAGPYLVLDRQAGTLFGGAGFAFETLTRANTGYVLARDAWGRGIATEALHATVALCPSLGVVRLQALCHAEHDVSHHVLEKCGFTCEGVLRRHSVFPNLTAEPCDVSCYARAW
jgi:[ribosomal protein S5]-alanine N-acetyltransferase